jgi:hypothetical protein
MSGYTPPLYVFMSWTGSNLRFRRVQKIAKSDYELRHVCVFVCLCVCQAVRMEQIGSLWTDFQEILTLEYF